MQEKVSIIFYYSNFKLNRFGKAYFYFHDHSLFRFREGVNKKICDSSIIHFVDKLDLSVKAVFCDHIPLFLCGGAVAQPVLQSLVDFIHSDLGKCCAHLMRPS